MGVWLWLTLPLAAATNLLNNPGFELDGPGQTTNLPGWTAYGPYDYSETGAAQAHTGTNYFKVYQWFNGAVNYSGVYQDYISGPGASYSASGWAFTATGDQLAGQNLAWIEVSFRDVNANVLALYRSAIISTNSIATGAFHTDQWNYLAVTNQYNPTTYQVTGTVTNLVAPAGTVFVRYQITFQGDANYSAGSVYFDDASLTQSGGQPYGNMNIVWSDEFNGSNINTGIWTWDTGNSGWGNNELENYTSRTNNSYLSGGYLHIVAQKESYQGSSYTSARLKSQGLFSFTCGRLEWRAQLPAGLGCWPALWLLGTNISSISWPGCGEIDVMENNGSNLSTVQGSIHSGTDATAYYNFLDGTTVTSFHIYTLDWATNAILFYVDGHLYETQTSWGSSTTNAFPFPFNKPFFIIMNLAIGGNYLGNPSISTINGGTSFPAQYLVDYVRLYAPTSPLVLNLQKTGKQYALTWPSNVVCSLQTITNLLQNSSNNWASVNTQTNLYPLTPSNPSAYYRLVSP